MVWAAALFLLATVLGVPAFTRDPGPAAGASPAYSQRVSVGYGSAGDPAVYDGGRVRTGDPVFLALTPSVDVEVTYELSGAQLSTGGGRIGLVARLSGANGWQRTVTLAAPRSFRGPRAHLATRVDLNSLWNVVRTMQERTGSTEGSLLLELVPQVHATSSVSTRSVATEYAPEVRFRLQQRELVLEDGGRHLRGKPITRTSSPSAEAGPAQLALLGRQIPVRTARMASAVLGLLALVAAAGGLLWRRNDALDPAARLGRPVIPVDAALLDRAAVEVSSLDALLDMAQRYDRPLLHARTAETTAYLLEQDGTWYRHCVHTTAVHATGS
jgi:hypothetical protein